MLLVLMMTTTHASTLWTSALKMLRRQALEFAAVASLKLTVTKMVLQIALTNAHSMFIRLELANAAAAFQMWIQMVIRSLTVMMHAHS
jgi:hypothetical protein